MAFPLLGPVILAGLKLLLIKLISLVVVYFVYKVLMAFSSTLIDWAMNQFTSNVNLSDATIQFTGMSAWLADNLMLSQTISLLISFCLVRFIIGIVRG
jgi:hypothetical protein